MKDLIKRRNKLYKKRDKVKKNIDYINDNIRYKIVDIMRKIEFGFDSKIKETPNPKGDTLKSIILHEDTITFEYSYYYSCGGSYEYQVSIPEKYFDMSSDEVSTDYKKLCQSVLDRKARDKKLKNLLK